MIDVAEMPAQGCYCLGCGASTTRPDLEFQVRNVYCEDTEREEDAMFCKGEQCVDSYLRPMFEALERAAGWIYER